MNSWTVGQKPPYWIMRVVAECEIDGAGNMKILKIRTKEGIRELKVGDVVKKEEV